MADRLGCIPAVYLPLARLEHRMRTRVGEPDLYPPPVGRRTDAVIEGFPRSANSFAVTAFRLAQDAPLQIAHHRHAAAQVIAGVRLGIPTLVLIRPPEEAVLSLAVVRPAASLEQALRSYASFYSACRPYAHGFVTAPFAEVTRDFGAVIEALNRRCGSAFTPFEHTPENVAECFRLIAHHHARRSRLSGVPPDPAHPSERRGELKDRLRDALDSPGLRGPRERAQALYDEYLSREGAGTVR